MDVVAVDADVQFQQADELFKFPDGSQLSSLTKEEYDSEVIAHGRKWSNILQSIEGHLVKGALLPEYIIKLNLNTANASTEEVIYQNGKTSTTLVFKITWCIVAFCTGASGKFYCRNGDLVLRKLDCEEFVDGLGHVFDRG